LPQSAGRRRLSSSTNPPRPTKRLARNAPRRALLDQTTTAALPRDRVHLTHGTCRGAANAPCSRTLMEILDWVTRRPRTDEMLRLDRATTRTSTRRRPDARHALAFRGERSASPSLLAFWEALR
jgi:hypothetical protein